MSIHGGIPAALHELGMVFPAGIFLSGAIPRAAARPAHDGGHPEGANALVGSPLPGNGRNGIRPGKITQSYHIIYSILRSNGTTYFHRGVREEGGPPAGGRGRRGRGPAGSRNGRDKRVASWSFVRYQSGKDPKWTIRPILHNNATASKGGCPWFPMQDPALR